MSCSRLHPNTICFHARSLLITSGISRPCVLVLQEVGRNLTMFRLDELAEDMGNGIILRIAGGDDDIFDSRWCGRRHVLGRRRRRRRRSGDAVSWDVEVSYMHFRSRVQSFELLQGLISKDIILVDPLVLRVRVSLPFDQVL